MNKDLIKKMLTATRQYHMLWVKTNGEFTKINNNINTNEDENEK